MTAHDVALDSEARAREGEPSSGLAKVPGFGSITPDWRPLSLVLLLGLLVRIPFIPLFAYQADGSTDEADWKRWMQIIHEQGVLNIFRTPDTNYVGYHWVLWLLSFPYGWLGGTYGGGNGGLFHVLIKLPSVGFDLLLVCVVYAATRFLVAQAEPHVPAGVSRHAEPLALLAALVVALQPAVIYDSAVWAQTDSLITAAMLAAIVLAFRGNVALAGAVWALGFLVKPQPIIILPVLLLIAYRSGGPRSILSAGLAGAAVGLAVLGPWLVHGDLFHIIKVYRWDFHDVGAPLSLAAWNLWRFWDATVTPAADDKAVLFVTYRNVGLGLSGLAAIVALAYAWARPDLRGALIAAAYLVFAFYMFPVRTHERYLFPLLGLLLPVVVVERRWLWLYVPLSAMFFLNLVGTAPPIKSLDGAHIHNPVFLVASGINVLLFLAYTASLAPRAWGVVDQARAWRAARTLAPA